ILTSSPPTSGASSGRSVRPPATPPRSLTTMPETYQAAPAVITESLDRLATAAELITDTNRHASTPCADWTVTQVLQHAAGDQLAWAAALGVGGGPSANPFAASGQLDGSVA